MEIALISLDGLDPRVIYRNIDELPNIKSLIKDCQHGHWTTPGHTIPSYIATLTGRQYNVYDFYWDEGGEFSRHRQTGYDFLWDITDSSMTLLNIPVLYPPENIDDVMVCGILTPNGVQEMNLARPNDVQEMLNELDYIPDVDSGELYDEFGEGMVDILWEIMNDRVDVAADLIEMYDSDLFYGVWTATDRWFHRAKMEDHDYFQMYEYADEIIGDLIDILPDHVPTVFFSDHGFAHYNHDNGVHKGHMMEGWYAIRNASVPPHRNDATSLFDLFPTVLNYLGEEIPVGINGRVLFHRDDQDQDIYDRLGSLGYLE